MSKYVSVGKSLPKLSKIGSKKWFNCKVEAEQSVQSMAADMLRLQAVRRTACSGFIFPQDDNAQVIFENSFPYRETIDQLRAIREVKLDMSKPIPMDRLLCGDVGYGKTEVAMRAAFKAVNSSKQVAILVPTTILAQQHYKNFIERFAEFPVNIEVLSRFKSPKQQKDVLKEVKLGKVDILIGTHRIIQKDVVFKDLGLLIIDEEQRFGVKHKEKLKYLRTNVDVLTMTATPIPRTLYMGMTGLKDISTIATAPQKRLPVKTVILKYDEKTIREAIENELQRGGQVFFLHNRVKTIDRVHGELKKILPDVKFAVAHGQMKEGELEVIMNRFIAGKLDVLISTTIIESGVDIPNANTIIIDQANIFGLAELYQLRGRVGRWNRQAYAYLLLPNDSIVSSVAKKRISAIKKYSHLGAGFRLAMRDLEIRGAGSLLGQFQSGHINSIGFELYCQLLRATVANLKGDVARLPVQIDLYVDFITFGESDDTKLFVGFSKDYITSEKLRLEMYRRLMLCVSQKDLNSFKAELKDRFGKLPISANNMLIFQEIRLLVADLEFYSLSVENEILIFKGAGKVKLKDVEDYLLLKGRSLQKKFSNILLNVKSIIKSISD